MTVFKYYWLLFTKITIANNRSKKKGENFPLFSTIGIKVITENVMLYLNTP